MTFMRDILFGLRILVMEGCCWNLHSLSTGVFFYCGDHFDPNQYATDKRERLKRNGIPTLLCPGPLALVDVESYLRKYGVKEEKPENMEVEQVINQDVGNVHYFLEDVVEVDVNTSGPHSLDNMEVVLQFDIPDFSGCSNDLHMGVESKFDNCVVTRGIGDTNMDSQFDIPHSSSKSNVLQSDVDFVVSHSLDEEGVEEEKPENMEVEQVITQHVGNVHYFFEDVVEVDVNTSGLHCVDDMEMDLQFDIPDSSGCSNNLHMDVESNFDDCVVSHTIGDSNMDSQFVIPHSSNGSNDLQINVESGLVDCVVSHSLEEEEVPVINASCSNAEQEPIVPLIRVHSRCAVSGCKNNNSTKSMFGFPRVNKMVDGQHVADAMDFKRCNEWVQFCKNPKILTNDISKLHKLFKVCGGHFSLNDFTS
ncbi:52 kDa repressor of the inhibitor of the protein kinase [Frankliniella fusca]|uniref:52 kDa repressor of the inhibitor of the protein kinase n=1 Tax=Frankliniella fusca TaxID=407009 RepID=A0AAE1HTA1_9NEOP|nr:52 kDa repressor of the inhibitor of the protein kinase [Frankliniella fusca]